MLGSSSSPYVPARRNGLHSSQWPSYGWKDVYLRQWRLQTNDDCLVTVSTVSHQDLQRILLEILGLRVTNELLEAVRNPQEVFKLLRRSDHSKEFHSFPAKFDFM